MAESLGVATLELEGDLGPLEKDLAAAKSKAGAAGASTGKRFSTAMAGGIRKATKPALVALGLIAVGAKGAITAASNLNEAQSAATVVFGKYADAVLRASQNQNDMFSQEAFLGAAKQFGTFGTAAGLAGRELVGFSTGLIDAAQDMASFHNVPIAQALEDIRSGLAGEVEPLRKYGVLLNDAALRQKALEMGLVRTTKDALTPQNKTLAAQQLILEGLGPAQGDYARTADSAANVEKRQAANTQDLNAKLGKGLLPAYQVLQGLLLRVTGFMGRHTTAVKVGTGVVAALAVAVLAARGGMMTYSAAMAVARFATLAFNAALAMNPIGLVIIALVALGVALFVLWKKSATFRKIVTAAFNGVKTVVKAVVNFIRNHWRKLFPQLALIVGVIRRVKEHFGSIRGAFQRVVNFLRDKIGVVVGFFRNLPGRLRGAAGDLFGFLKDKFRAALNAIISLWNNLRIPGMSIDPLGKLGPAIHTPEINFPNIPTLHGGGTVPGRPGTETLAILEAGETVMPRGGGRNVTVQQFFTEPPADPFPWLRKSRFAAEAVYG